MFAMATSRTGIEPPAGSAFLRFGLEPGGAPSSSRDPARRGSRPAGPCIFMISVSDVSRDLEFDIKKELATRGSRAAPRNSSAPPNSIYACVVREKQASEARSKRFPD